MEDGTLAVELIDKGLKIDNALRLSTGNESSIPTKTQLAKACVANGDKFREKLAEKIDVTPKFCADIELGVKGISVPTLCKLSEALFLKRHGSLKISIPPCISGL